MIFLLHVALSISSPALTPEHFMFLLHVHFHLVSGHPLVLFPGVSSLNTCLSVCSSSLLITFPHQYNRLSVIFLEVCATLVVPRMCSFPILSLRVTPHVHLSIFISFTSIRFLHQTYQTLNCGIPSGCDNHYTTVPLLLSWGELG